jgi:hypothetical protein
MVEELCRLSPEFEAMWRDNTVSGHGGGIKQLMHPEMGVIRMEYSAFAVDGRPDLAMLVYNPTTNADAELIRKMVREAAQGTA